MNINSETIRTFIAFKISKSEKLLTVLDTFKTDLVDEKIKWVEPDNLHFTLKFLGETSWEQVEKIKTELENLSQYPQFSVNINGCGFFDRNGEPAVLFLKINENELLQQLYSEIIGKLENIGFKDKKRIFKAHLTLGRIKFLKNKTIFFKAVRIFENEYIQKEQISEIIFYQSVLHPSGAKYYPIQKVQLQPAK